MESTCDRKRKAPKASSRLEQPVKQDHAKDVCSRPSSNEIFPEFICTVCHEVLLDPAVAHCGHDLCRHCWIGWLPYKRQCPMCRISLPPLIPSTCFRLKTLVERLHPEAVAARRKELAPKLQHIESVLAAHAQQQQQMGAMFPPRYPASSSQPTHPQGFQVARSSTNSQPHLNMDTTLSIVVSSVQHVQQMNDTMDATLGAIDRMLRGINDIQQNLEEVQGLLPTWAQGPPLDRLTFTIGDDSDEGGDSAGGGSRRRRRRRGGSSGGRHTNSHQQR